MEKIISMKNIYKLIIFGLLCCLAAGVFSQTPKEVYKELRMKNVLYPKIVLAQSILETGWFKCEYCSLSKNNLFGLWNSKQQKYFEYDDWRESIDGYLSSIQYKYHPRKYSSYYDFLKRIGYASDPKYISKLKSIVKKINEEII